ncbi:unnamed protein product, partial [Meganyctiphanes norvegica]
MVQVTSSIYYTTSRVQVTISIYWYRRPLVSAVLQAGLMWQQSYYSSPKVKSDYQGMVVDLRSDTLTKPSKGMKDAMMKASLGDDVYNEDPTCKELERRMAEYTGKEAALFVSSGTMGNLLSILSHCGRRGAEVLLGDQTHIFLAEQGGMAQFGGVQANNLSTNPNGTFDLNEVISRIRGDDIHLPSTDLICVENTHNKCGGKVLPQDWIDQLGIVAHSMKIPLHMDGARLINAAVATGETPAKILANCDTASVCFSKGLGTPVGSVIVGPQEFITKAHRLRKALGGGMRQVGVLAAAALYALDNNVDRLAEDHKHAQLLAKAVTSMQSCSVKAFSEEVHTNIFLAHLDTDIISPQKFCSRLATVSDQEVSELGEAVVIKANAWPGKVRMVLHHDIGSDQVEAAVAKLKYVIQEIDTQDQ